MDTETLEKEVTLQTLLADRDLVVLKTASQLDMLNVLMKGSNYRNLIEEDDLPIIRKALREELLGEALINEQDSTFAADFSGSGDSGNYHGLSQGYNHPMKDLVNWFFESMVEVHVTFDWYNNDGGGGEICWDVFPDVITISGYQNVTTTESVMRGEF